MSTIFTFLPPRAVERKKARLDFRKRKSVFRTRIFARQQFFFLAYFYRDNSLSFNERALDGFCQTHAQIIGLIIEFMQREFVDQDIDVVLLVLFQIDPVTQIFHLTVETYFLKTFS